MPVIWHPDDPHFKYLN